MLAFCIGATLCSMVYLDPRGVPYVLVNAMSFLTAWDIKTYIEKDKKKAEDSIGIENK